MKKVIKFIGILMIISASLMVGLTNSQSLNDKNLCIENLITISTANAELYPGELPYLQNCISCPYGAEYYCAMAGTDRCFNLPCGGGYC